MLTAAEWGYKGQVEGAQIRADASMYGDDQQLAGVGLTSEATKYGAFAAADASKYGADATERARMYEADQTLRGRLAPSFSYSESRAKGGLALAARPYLVGEKGPELMVPDQSGTIVPNHKLPMSLRNAIPRAAGGRVDAEGISAQNLTNWREGAAPHAAYKKDLMAAETQNKISLLQAAADIDPDGGRKVNLAQAAALNVAADKANVAAQHDTYGNMFKDEHSIFVPGKEGKASFALPDDEGLRRLYRQGDSAVGRGATPEEAIQAIQPDIHKHYATPENVDKVLAASGQPVTPELRASMLAGTPGVNAALYPKIKALLSQPKPKTAWYGSTAP